MAGLLEVHLFGRFTVRRGEQALVGLESSKVQQMLCYLLLYRDHPHPREALAHLLWADEQSDQPNKRLRKTLWQVRNALDAPSESSNEPLLWIDAEWIQINPQADLWLDTALFEQAYNQARGVPGSALDAASTQALRHAVDLYRGGLQESWYQDWYLYERERFRHTYLILLDKLMDYSQAWKRYEEGLAYGTLILRCDPASERTHRRLMQLYYLAGDRTAALRQYERCAHALAQELGVEPAQSTMSLYQRIRADRLAPTAPTSPAPAHVAHPVSTTASPLPALLQRLLRLERALVDLEDEVRQDIQIVRLSMDGH